jgi:DNA-binding SARP family transcriptional activator
MKFRILGELEVSNGTREVALGSGKRRALLALLLLHRNEVVPAERLIEELWDGRPPASAAKGLQVQVSRLRKALAPLGGAGQTPLRTKGHGYVLEVAPDDVDVTHFERALIDGEGALAAGEPDRAAERLREGLQLWRGPPLADFTYDAFAQDEIARLQELRLTALERRIDADLALGRHHELVPEVQGLLRANPLRDQFRCQLMLALYRCGRRIEALDVYRDGRRLCLDDLGLEPGPELRALEKQIFADSPDLAPPRRMPPSAERAARRAPWVILAAGVLLAVAAIGALRREQGAHPPIRAPAAVDVAANSVVELAPRGGSAVTAVPLPGRPTDMAARDDQLLVVSVDRSALTVVDGRTRRITRAVPLSMRPSAVAAGPGHAWVADGGRGLLVRLDGGYRHVARRLSWSPPRSRVTAATSERDPTRLAVTGGAAWVTDGSSTLRRAGAAGRLTGLHAPVRLAGVAAGAGAVWAVGTQGSVVIRVDPRRRRVTDVIRIAQRGDPPGLGAVAITVTHDAVWVLNARTATVLRIGAHDLRVAAGIALNADQDAYDIEQGAGAVWVANRDGSVTRIPVRGGRVRSWSVGGSLVGVAGGPRRVWLANVALPQHIPQRAR